MKKLSNLTPVDPVKAATLSVKELINEQSIKKRDEDNRDKLIQELDQRINELEQELEYYKELVKQKFNNINQGLYKNRDDSCYNKACPCNIDNKCDWYSNTYSCNSRI